MKIICALLAAGAAMASPIWPEPKQSSFGAARVELAPSKFVFRLASGSSPTLDTAFKRYQGLLFPHTLSSSAGSKGNQSAAVQIGALDVIVEAIDESHPQLDTDESYKLSINADGSAALSAKTIYGAMHGLESFSQLVNFDFENETYAVGVAPVSIDDAPRFPERGLMMDTARHFETLQAIRDMIDSLPYAKINVLHWHMTDSQSFPFESKTYPKLWEGRFSDSERYLQSDIAEIVEYARLRGVRVLVEFDVPGHAGAWCKGHPEICPSATCLQPLNVANEATFDVINGVVKEVSGGTASTPGRPSGLFPTNQIHLGGDEVDTSCWSNTPAVSKWLSGRNMTPDDAYAYFLKRASDIAIANGRDPIQWSEVWDHFGNKLNNRTIVHVWKPVTNVTAVVAAGYRVITNVGYVEKSWYLDNLNVMWNKVYAYEPCDGIPDDLCHKVLGGHGEMWGETVDMSDLEQTVWPRLAAIGERLWSPRNVTDPASALVRLEDFRCLLNQRGVHAAPVTNPIARSGPVGPGSCYKQRR